MAVNHGLDDRGIRVPVGARNFSPHSRAQTGSGAHPASYPIGTSVLSLRLKRPVHEADNSPLSSTSIPPIRLHDVVLI